MGSMLAGACTSGTVPAPGAVRGRVLDRLWAWMLTLLLACAAPLAMAQDDFLDPADAFRFSAALAADGHVDIHYQVAPAYYMYRDRFEFSAEAPAGGEVIGDPAMPPALVKYDPTFEMNMAVYYGQVTVRLPVQLAAGQQARITVVSQGCADAGLCYPPDETVLALRADAAGTLSLQGPGVVAQVPAPLTAVIGADGKPQDAAGVAATGVGSGLSGMADTGIAAFLAQASLPEIALAGLLLGLMLSFTPCVLPMAPILLAVLTGSGQPLSRGRGFLTAAMFVLGTSIVYTALGLAAAAMGASLAAWLQVPWVLGLFAALLALLALSMFDVFTLQTPAALQTRMQAWMDKLPGGRLGGAFVTGMVTALIVGPCVAAPLAGVLLFISQTGDQLVGALALFSLAWGQGVILLLLGLTSGVLLVKAGPWMVSVKYGFGILLLATAWWLLGPVLPAGLSMLGWAVLGLWTAGLLGVGRRLPDEAGVGRLLVRALGLAVAAWAVMMLVGLASGGRDPLSPLSALRGGAVVSGGAAGVTLAPAPVFQRVENEAELDAALAAADRPVLLDFYADWCVSCIEMERNTFPDPAVAERLQRFVLLKADVTANTPAHRALLRRFQLFGPPGIIFHTSDARLLDEPRVIGFQAPDRFAASLDQALAAAR